jgi:hypothetical protein
MEIKEQKEYREERFEFALYVNDNLICKRNFRINNFIEDSMNSMEFKNVVDNIVHMIDNDLKSKSRVYTWYTFNDKEPDEEFTNPLIEPWECTFKFVIFDNKREVISKIWDGRGYPKSVREKVDLANKFVKIIGKDGRISLYDKDAFFETNKDKLTHDLYILRAQINDKPDVLLGITREICKVCSPREGSHSSINDFTMSDTFTRGDIQTKYNFGKAAYKKYISDWAKAVNDKTKKYFSNLY